MSAPPLKPQQGPRAAKPSGAKPPQTPAKPSVLGPSRAAPASLDKRKSLPSAAPAPARPPEKSLSDRLKELTPKAKASLAIVALAPALLLGAWALLPDPAAAPKPTAQAPYKSTPAIEAEKRRQEQRRLIAQKALERMNNRAQPAVSPNKPFRLGMPDNGSTRLPRSGVIGAPPSALPAVVLSPDFAPPMVSAPVKISPLQATPPTAEKLALARAPQPTPAPAIDPAASAPTSPPDEGPPPLLRRR